MVEITEFRWHSNKKDTLTRGVSFLLLVVRDNDDFNKITNWTTQRLADLAQCSDIRTVSNNQCVFSGNGCDTLGMTYRFCVASQK